MSFKKDELDLYANLMKIQSHQLDLANKNVSKVHEGIELFKNVNEETSDEIDSLIQYVENLDLTTINFSEDDINQVLTLTPEEELKAHNIFEEFEKIKYIETDSSWDDFVQHNLDFAEFYSIDLSSDPFEYLLSDQERKEILKSVEENYNLAPLSLNKTDYFMASFSGILSGLIDVFFIGEPLKSKKFRAKKSGKYSKDEINKMSDSFLSKKVNEGFDSIVQNIASAVYEYDKKKGKLVKNQNKKFDTLAGAIGYLEERYKVNYDARYAKDLGLTNEELQMTPLNHHLKSLGHQPDIIGLLFSILDQFMNTTSVIDDGKIKIIKNKKFDVVKTHNGIKVKGKGFLFKILCGAFNWLGHLVSDVAGSSGTRGHADKQGAGIPIPFYSLTQLITKKFKDKDGVEVSFAKIAEKVFTNGYDFRFGATLVIPVLINEVLIRAYWSIKEILFNKKNIKDILRINMSKEIDRLLLVGHGVLVCVDFTDAAIRSGGGYDLYTLLTRSNIIAWARFGLSSMKELMNVYQKHVNLNNLDQDIYNEWLRIYES